MVIDEIVPVYLDRLRSIYFAHLNELPDKPTIEDWYRFESAVKAASLVKVRALRDHGEQ